MRKRIRTTSVFLAFFLALCAGCAKKDGAVTGTVAPPTPGVSISAVQNDKTVATLTANAQDGKFSMALAPGAYDIRVSVPGSPLPLSFPSVVIKSGQTTELPPIGLGQPSGKTVLSGRITPAGSGTKVSLYAEGRERASVATDNEGKYQFIELSAGSYTIQANTPGYASGAAELSVANDQTVTRNMKLFFVSTIDGVDWGAGKIRVTGVGMPPAKATNATVSREMARRAALADGQRKLLLALDRIQVGPNQPLKQFWGEQRYTATIQGFISGYTVAGERALEGGKFEIDLELPLTGEKGLDRFLAE